MKAKKDATQELIQDYRMISQHYASKMKQDEFSTWKKLMVKTLPRSQRNSFKRAASSISQEDI